MERGSVQCQGAPSADFQRLMERYARDLGATVAKSSSRPVAVLLEYQGQRAYGAAPAAPLGLDRGEVRAEYLAPSDEGGGGVSCRCNTSGSCPKDGQWPASWCDASSCKSCTMNY
jgi:hypothetical protein